MRYHNVSFMSQSCLHFLLLKFLLKLVCNELSVFINDLLKEVEQAELGIQLSSGKTFGGMLFADDFVGVSDSNESLQKLIDVVYSYCTCSK